MFLKQLQLTNFKNHEKKEYHFSKNLNIFFGKNGVGKTNTLDAIYLLCIGKSYFNTSDINMVHFNHDFYRIKMQLLDTEENNVVISYKLRGSKNIEINKQKQGRISSLVGKFPVVMLCPSDQNVIVGSSEHRRKYMNQSLCQVNSNYLSTLMQYNKILKQRNAFLKQQKGRLNNKTLLHTYNDSLIPLGKNIFEERIKLLDHLKSYFTESFTHINAKKEAFSLHYNSQLLNKNFEQLLYESEAKDIALGRTTKGIHKDDLSLKIHKHTVKEFGSQGQQKTLLTALKLTQFNYLKNNLKKVPLFLIDDIFDKLDKERSLNLVAFLSSQEGQVFISNTSKDAFSVLDEVNIFEIT